MHFMFPEVPWELSCFLDPVIAVMSTVEKEAANPAN